MQADTPDILRRAQDAVHAADLVPEFRVAGFLAAALLEGGAGLTSPASGSSQDDAPANRTAAADPISALAEKVSVNRETVESVFYVDADGRLQLGIARGKLGRRKAEAARQVALLTSVCRQFDGSEQFTKTHVIRTACQEYGVFDTGNFAKTLVAMSDVFQFQGSGVSRSVRVVRPGYEEAGRMVQAFAA